MTFLQPIVLFGLPLILVPVIVHLLNRLRYRTQRWAAMRFLLAASRSSVSQARLKEWLILLFRTLAVAALIFFLSRPLVGGWLGWAFSAAPDAIIVILDRSASMEALAPDQTISLREQAIEMLTDSARDYQESSDLVLIDSATGSAQRMQGAADLKDHPLAGPTETAADLPALLQKAFEWMVENQAGTTEIWIASDLQESNWRPHDDRWKRIAQDLASLPQKVRVRLLGLHASAGVDRSIRLVERVERVRGGDHELLFALDLEQNAIRKDKIFVERRLAGGTRAFEVDMEGGAQTWRQRVALGTNQERGWGSFKLPSDQNPGNNEVFFVFDRAAELGAIVVGDRGGLRDLFRLAASDFTGANPRFARGMGGWETDQTDWSDQTLILWQDPLPEPVTAARLRSFASEGGVVLFFPPAKSDPGRFDGMGWGGVERAESGGRFVIGRWEQGSGPLADSDEGIALPLDTLEIYRRQRLFGRGFVVGAFSDGEPFLIRRTVGKGSVYFCASLPLPDWSTLGEGPVLVPMIQRLLELGGARKQRIEYSEVGSLSAPDWGRHWTRVDQNGDGVGLRAGVYQAKDRWMAMNRPAIEDGSDFLDAARVASLFGDVAVETYTQPAGRGAGLQGEAWRFFLGLMIVFLLIEGYLILPAKGRHELAGRFAPIEAAGKAG